MWKQVGYKVKAQRGFINLTKETHLNLCFLVCDAPTRLVFVLSSAVCFLVSWFDLLPL